MVIFTEGVFNWLLKMFSFDRMNQEIKNLEKLQDDPGLQARLKKMKIDGEDLKESMRIFCRDHPDHWLCKPDAFTDKSKGTMVVHK